MAGLGTQWAIGVGRACIGCRTATSAVPCWLDLAKGTVPVNSSSLELFQVADALSGH